MADSLTKLQIKNYKLKLKGIIVILFLFIGVFTVASPVHANAPSTYGMDYGLLVHQKNQHQIVPSIKALEVLLKFFPNATNALVDVKSNKEICDLPFLNCGNRFYSYRPISQKDFLIWFYQLSRLDEGKNISNEPVDALYRKLWLEARNNNWLESGGITYRAMQEFMYRYKISAKLNGMPYFEGLVLDSSEISTANFNDIYDVIDYQSDIFERILTLKATKNRSKSQDKLLEDLNKYYQAFKDLETELRIMRHPINLIKDLPGEIKDKIVKYDMNEVLNQISYDYSKNNNNRKYNLTHGLTKVSGKVLMPGDVLDLMEALSDQNWGDYKWGWVILGGTEQWQLGGGLCGTATMIFTPSWRAGLQIIKRYPHSAYYKSLYPTESMGLDATIYRNSHKNLKIRNNFDSPIMYYAKNDEEKQVATVYVLGNSPYRHIDIEGPIQEARTTYKWIRHMEYPDGVVNTEELVTKYGAVY